MNNLWVCQKVFKGAASVCLVHFIIDKHVLWVKESDLVDLLGISRDQILEAIAHYKHKSWYDFVFLTYSFMYSHEKDVPQGDCATPWPLDTSFIGEHAISAALTAQKNILRKGLGKSTNVSGISKVEPYAVRDSQSFRWLQETIRGFRSLITLQKLILDKQNLVFTEPCLKQVFKSVDASKIPIIEGRDNHLMIFRDPCNIKKYKMIFCKEEDVDRVCDINLKTQFLFLQYKDLPNQYRGIYYAMKAFLIHTKAEHRCCDFDQIIEFDGSIEKLVTDAFGFLKYRGDKTAKPQTNTA